MKLSSLAKLVKVVKTLRGFLMGILMLAIAIPVALYIALSSDWAQNKIRSIGAGELSALLGTKVEIDAVEFSPFNRLKILGVAISDDFGATAAFIRELDTRVELWDLILDRKIIIDYASLDGVDLHLYRDSVGAPLNISNIIRRLSSDDKDKPEKVFRLRLNDVEMRSSSFAYDVLSEPLTPGRFNLAHISVSDISLMAFAPVVANDNYRFWLRKLSCKEGSGIVLSDLSANCSLSNERLLISGLKVELPNSLLSFSDINLPLGSIRSIQSDIMKSEVSIGLMGDSHVSLSDLKAFEPMFSDLPYTFDIALDADLSLHRIDIRQLRISDYDKMFAIDAKGTVNDFRHIDSIYSDDLAFTLAADSVAISSYLAVARHDISDKVRSLLGALGNTAVTAHLEGSAEKGRLDLSVSSRLARLDLQGSYRRPAQGDVIYFDAEAFVDSLLLGRVLANPDFRSISAGIKGSGQLAHRKFTGLVNTDISHFYFKGHRYSDISASASIDGSHIMALLDIDNDNLSIRANAEFDSKPSGKSLKGNLEIDRASFAGLNLSEKLGKYSLSGRLSLDAAGESIDRFSGNLNLSDLSVNCQDGRSLFISHLSVEADNLRPQGFISLSSDLFNGSIDGRLRFTSIGREMEGLVARILPALVKENGGVASAEGVNDYSNKFAFDFKINDTEMICDFFGIPISVVGSANLYGNFDGARKSAFLAFDAPWIMQGNNVIEDTSLGLKIDGEARTGVVQVASLIPTKKGDMDVLATVSASGGRLLTDIDWSLIRAIPINGNIDFTASFDRSTDNKLITGIKFNPGRINFGNEIWEISPSNISIDNNYIRVDNFALNAPSQSIVINGVAGASPDDRLTVDLRDIELINIFETLEIDKALISGRATGTVAGSALLSSSPVIVCDELKVKSIGYNYCTLGDADVRLSLDDGGKIFNFSAVIENETEQLSYIDGFIEPTTETLDLIIDADKVKVGFMKPFMEAFTSHVEGFASGYAHLFGTFKNIDLTGDIYAQDLKIKIDFTNTWYMASDSITIRPGIINLDKVSLSDEYGHKAVLDGWVAHKYFHDASFHFDVKDATDFLCYDVNKKLSPDWYGRIFGNGTATIKGYPGVVDISANMTTAPQTTFTFVLSDRLDANEYSFITFRDVTPRVAEPDSLILSPTIPEKVMSARSKKNSDATDVPTAYNMDIGVDIRPQAEINIIMDPIGGDSIRSNGEGHMRMTYGSVDNDMRLYGTYTLEHGNYNFTLQDLIVKDLTIKEGSSIYFPGDPYKAKLNIMAYYPVQANLSDLDESFLQDKELNRTKVPVRALVNITGDMLQPDVSFDLEFPTLSQDIYRKVRSIISTEDMMNRQIIYLLAINRFYTPEYMASTTKGSELFSVVSSTISSRLSSMLGKLSDNWSIAPNLRSDRGDFSDLEVDLTLSSSLLNNRLLLNGNFGYRDKSLNTNQFVGDFDVEYLLNRSGEWRLKAYNRYNDQNYYLRTAQTTQGVGIQYRRDFDKTLRFLKHFRRKKDTDEDARQDSVPADSVGSVAPLPPIYPESTNNPQEE